MKINFLGTAAAEGVPALFCNCDTCIKAKKSGGTDIRTRSQIMIDDSILIDFPMDSYFHMIKHSLDLSAVTGVFITHSHMDHFYPQELTLHGEPYSHNMKNPVLKVYANETVIKRSKLQIKNDLKKSVEKTLNFITLKPYDKVQLDGLIITALPACHTKGENCFVYLVQNISENKTYLQFNDSGILDDEVYEYLKAQDIKIDLVSYDCTYGYLRKGKGRHMGILDNDDERNRMEKLGIAGKNTLHVLTHFSHNCQMLHEEIKEKVKDMNFIVAYDGLEIEI